MIVRSSDLTPIFQGETENNDGNGPEENELG
jgi:hypothetical protein